MGACICPGCGQVAEPADLAGVEVQGVYDGVLVWQHVGCGHQWPRFASGRLHDLAVDWLAVKS
jgi:hypothetical protein